MIFGLWALKGLIPCRAIFANRHVVEAGGCPGCQNGAEDIKHMLFTCDRAREVWRSLGIWESIQRLLGTDRSGLVILEEIIRRGEWVDVLDVGLAELILTGVWYIWWEQRQYVHGENTQWPSRSAMSMAALTKNYKVAMKKGAKLWQGWMKAPEGKFMVNVDASFDENAGCGSVGAILRDCTWGVVAAAHCFVSSGCADGRGICVERRIDASTTHRV